MLRPLTVKLQVQCFPHHSNKSSLPLHQLIFCWPTGKSHSYSPLKRLKACEDQMDGTGAKDAIDSDDAELARKLHEQLNGPDSPTAVPITRHASRVRKAPVFYKPEVLHIYTSPATM